MTDQDIADVRSTYEGTENGNITINDENAISLLNRYHDTLKQTENSLSASRTAAL